MLCFCLVIFKYEFSFCVENLNAGPADSLSISCSGAPVQRPFFDSQKNWFRPAILLLALLSFLLLLAVVILSALCENLLLLLNMLLQLLNPILLLHHQEALGLFCDSALLNRLISAHSSRLSSTWSSNSFPFTSFSSSASFFSFTLPTAALLV